jgi:2-(1,2-epoxy-1,2-dihydrophenyl)acetyl-CoA isomerase
VADGITVSRDGAVLRITLARPEVGNALDVPMCRALMKAAIAADEDDAVRCVLLSGEGKLFCAGGDVAGFSQAGERLPAYLKEITAYVHAAVVRLVRMGKPVVVALNGAAAGAGVGLAVLGDIVLAAPNASFALAYTGIGLSPDGGTTWLLPRLIGLRRTQELCLLNKRVKAQEAATLGLVTRIIDGDLMTEAMAVARELAAGATHALGTTRRLLLESGSASLETQLDAESRAISGLARTRDGREGVAAFVDKRAPTFTGE